MPYSNTPLDAVLKGIGEIPNPASLNVPILIPGGEQRNFTINHKQHEFKQIVLTAYEIENNGLDMYNRLKDNIKNKLGGVEVLGYPYSDEEGLKEILKDLSTHFNCAINPDDVLIKSDNGKPQILGILLYIAVVTTVYYR